MKLLGIIAEYDPFHFGHQYHMEKSREVSGCGGVVCVTSGDFTQRGGAALLDKYARAEAAVRCGADLVIELPLPWCMAGAETFARGGVGLLHALGCVDALSFGSECGDAEKLMSVAELLLSEELEEKLREQLSLGLPYAAARQSAVESLAGAEAALLLSQPNNILGIEYCKALLAERSAIRPLSIAREGSAHNGSGSASELRALYRVGNDVLPLLPESSAAVLQREAGLGRIPDPFLLETALLSRLRMLTEADFHALPDCAEGLENRLFRAARLECGEEAILDAAVSKRYPRARLRRMLWSAALGLQKADSEGLPPYIRPLCASEKGLDILHEIKKSASLPLLSRGGDVKELDEKGKRVFALSSGAHDFYVLGCKEQKMRQSDEDYKKSLVIFR